MDRPQRVDHQQSTWIVTMPTIGAAAGSVLLARRCL